MQTQSAEAGPAEFTTFMHAYQDTVATNLALNHLTRYKRRWRLFSDLKPTVEVADTAAPEVDWEVPDTLVADLGTEQQRALIDDALRRLPEHQRVALVLYHFEDHSYQEIADVLDASLSKIKTDIRRARAALLPLLRSSGVDDDRSQGRVSR